LIFSQPLTVAYVPDLRFATTPSKFLRTTSLNKSTPRPSKPGTELQIVYIRAAWAMEATVTVGHQPNF
jgi:hypothetical protein